jgi:hypothetical protein
MKVPALIICCLFFASIATATASRQSMLVHDELLRLQHEVEQIEALKAKLQDYCFRCSRSQDVAPCAPQQPTKSHFYGNSSIYRKLMIDDITKPQTNISQPPVKQHTKNRRFGGDTLGL